MQIQELVGEHENGNLKNGVCVAKFGVYPNHHNAEIYQHVFGLTNWDLDSSKQPVDVKLDGKVTKCQYKDTTVTFVVERYNSKTCHVMVYFLKRKVSFDKNVQVLGPKQSVLDLITLKDPGDTHRRCRRLNDDDRKELLKERPDYAWMLLRPHKGSNDQEISLDFLLRKLQNTKSDEYSNVAIFDYDGPECVLGDVLEGQTIDSLDHRNPRITGLVLEGTKTYVNYMSNKILFEVFYAGKNKYKLCAKLI